MKELNGVTRIAFLAFFASHIPITLMVDGQALLPRSIYPEFAVRALDWYTETFSDPLMKRPQLWFQSMVACEFLFQLPFFVVAVIALLNPGTVCLYSNPMITYQIFI